LDVVEETVKAAEAVVEIAKAVNAVLAVEAVVVTAKVVTVVDHVVADVEETVKAERPGPQSPSLVVWYKAERSSLLKKYISIPSPSRNHKLSIIS